MNVYNEIDPFAVQWLRALVAEGHVAPGVVEQTGVEHFRPRHVEHATQAHFFAGIGVWSHALRLAGWPDDRPVWTGSCPCQPFSAAGSREGAVDARHLWPAWFALIRECRPPVIFGEQVASKAGRHWLDAVSADMETLGYAVGSADLCAAGVGAPHVRQRLFWVAITDGGYSNRGADESVRKQEERTIDRRDSPNHLPDPTWGADSAILSADGIWRPWSRSLDDWIPESLADGPTVRVGRLRGYGNTIVAPRAAKFVRCVMEIT